MGKTIDTDKFSTILRQKSVDLSSNRLLVTRLAGSEQESDLSAPTNCNGFGRIRHFRRLTSDGWPSNPLPIDPACKALGLNTTDDLTAQVFQNASCNWRCWYCYVPFALLNANLSHSSFLSPSELIDLYLSEVNRPIVIDLTGGQPDLVPEWVPWMMKELTDRGLADQVYLWSDDNLSNDYFWKYLSENERRVVSEYKNYGKVCCFKGFDRLSFEFNTGACMELFDRQFDLFAKHLKEGIDVYAYVTFTTPELAGIDLHMRNFVDRLQSIHALLPLRVVPLEISRFSTTKSRMRSIHYSAIVNQVTAVTAWQNELAERFSSKQLSTPINEISCRNADE